MAKAPTNPLKRLLMAMLKYSTDRAIDRVPRSALGFLTRPYTPVDLLCEMLVSAGVPELEDEKVEGRRGYPAKYFRIADIINALDTHFPLEDSEVA